MNSRLIANGILRAIAIITGILCLLFLISKIQVVIYYIAISAVLSLIGKPIVSFLNKKLKNTISVIITMFIFGSIFISIIGLLIPLVVEQGQNLSLLDIEKLQSNFEDLYVQVLNYFEINQTDAKSALKNSRLLSNINLGVIPNLLNSIISGLGSFSIGLLSVLFITFFFLKDSKLFENSILAFIANNSVKRTRNSFSKISDLLSRYFVGLMIQILVLFIIYTIVLLIFGINNAFVIAFICALMNLIPYVGPLISGFLMMILTMTSNMGASFSEVVIPKTTYVMIGFMIGQLIDNFVSQPIIFSKSVKSHPLEIFIVIITSGILFGVIGMVVAIPTYTAVKVILKEFLYDYKFVQKLTKDL